MRTQFDNQLKELNLDMIKMAGAVEDAIKKSVSSLMNNDKQLAMQSVEFDNIIDNMERQIESRCLKILLQQQPVAHDLRRVSSALKMVTDMERIGDHAADIAELVIRMSDYNTQPETAHIQEMSKATIMMVLDCIDAYVTMDVVKANAVIKSDDIVDELFCKVRDELIESILQDKTKGECAIDHLMIAKYFERIGDHAVNIAEWVVFSITGVHKSTAIM